jgi:phosphoglycolate phosphatase-like HAD superfamily hydrolase
LDYTSHFLILPSYFFLFLDSNSTKIRPLANFPSMIRLVLFDIDGTLIESGGAGVKAFGKTCAMEFKVPNGVDRLRFAGRTDRSIVREFFGLNHIAPTEDNFQRFFDCYVFWLDHLLPQTNGRVLPGVFELLKSLSALRKAPAIGLLTGNIRLGAQIKLSHYELWHPFQTGGFGDDHEDRDQIAVIARDRACGLLKKKLRGEEILVIGDTPLDVKCGRAIGARTLAVATGTFKVDQLHPCKPTWLVEDLRQVTRKELRSWCEN